MAFALRSASFFATSAVCLTLVVPSSSAAQASIESVLADAKVASVVCQLNEVLVPAAFESGREDDATVTLDQGRVSVSVSRGYSRTCLREVFSRALGTLGPNAQIETQTVRFSGAPSRHAVSSRALRWVLAQMGPSVAECGRSNSSARVTLAARREGVLLRVSNPRARECVRGRFENVLTRLANVMRGQQVSRASARTRIAFAADRSEMVDPFQRATPRDQRATDARSNEVLVPDSWVSMDAASGRANRTPRTRSRNNTRMARPRATGVPMGELVSPFGDP